MTVLLGCIADDVLGRAKTKTRIRFPAAKISSLVILGPF